MNTPVRVETRQGCLSYTDRPLCTDGQINAALSIVASHQAGLFSLLPEDHIWNAGKQQHMSRANVAKQPLVDEMRNVISPSNFRLLEFIFRVHDLGRVIEGADKLGTLPPGITYCGNHAEQSVRLLNQWGALNSFTLETRGLIEYVIRHHVGAHSLCISELDAREPIEATALLFTWLFRDADKYLIFKDRTHQYLYDGEKKSGEMRVHEFAGELCRIDPEDFLATFGQHQVPNKNRIVSYEAYMLYYLSWIFDVNLRSVLQSIVETGAISMLLAYFYQQLPRDVAAQIEKATREYLAETGLSTV